MPVAGDCPDCGEPLRPDGRFCKACGWDADLEETGDAYLDGLDIPDAFTEEDYRAALGDAGLGRRPDARRRLAIAVAVVVTIIALLLALR